MPEYQSDDAHLKKWFLKVARATNHQAMDDDEIDAWLDDSDASDASDASLEEENEVTSVETTEPAVAAVVPEEGVGQDDDAAHEARESEREEVQVEEEQQHEDEIPEQDQQVLREPESASSPPPPAVRDREPALNVNSFASGLGTWASASFSKARQTLQDVSSTEVARTLRSDLREFAAHVTGGDDAASTSGSDSGEDSAPTAQDAARLAEQFASSAWASFGSAANRAKKALEKAEGALEDARHDPKAFATNVKGKAQSMGMGALNAFTSVVKVTADALAGDEEHAENILMEKLGEYGADAHREDIKVACERAMDALMTRATEEEQRTIRESVRKNARVLADEDASSAVATSSTAALEEPVSPGGSTTLVAVPLDGAEPSSSVSAEVLVELVHRIDACASDIKADLVSRIDIAVTSTSERLDFVCAIEDGLMDLRDDATCDSLARLTALALERVVVIANEEPKVSSRDAAARLAGFRDDVDVLCTSAKEAISGIVQDVREAWLTAAAESGAAPLTVAEIEKKAIVQIDADASFCRDALSHAKKKLAWCLVIGDGV